MCRCQVFSSVSLHLNCRDRVPHWTQSFWILLGCLANELHRSFISSLICADPCWGYRCVPSFYVGSNPNFGVHSYAWRVLSNWAISPAPIIFSCKFKWIWICRSNIVFDFYLLSYLSLFLLFSETRSCCIAKIGLKLAVEPRLASCLSLLSVGITDMLCGSWFWLSFQLWRKQKQQKNR